MHESSVVRSGSLSFLSSKTFGHIELPEKRLVVDTEKVSTGYWNIVANAKQTEEMNQAWARRGECFELWNCCWSRTCPRSFRYWRTEQSLRYIFRGCEFYVHLCSTEKCASRNLWTPEVLLCDLAIFWLDRYPVMVDSMVQQAVSSPTKAFCRHIWLYLRILKEVPSNLVPWELLKKWVSSHLTWLPLTITPMICCKRKIKSVLAWCSVHCRICRMHDRVQ